MHPYRTVRHVKVILTCSECGKTFAVSESYLKARVSEPTCGQPCRRAKVRRLKAGWATVPCAVCGVMFAAKLGWLRSGRKKVCSWKCIPGLQVRPSAEERFWSRVSKDGAVPAHTRELGACWPRIAAGPKGYSTISVNNKPMMASHFAWSLASGEPFPAGMWILHACDTPSCVRADGPLSAYTIDGIEYPRYGHLVLAPGQKANMADAANKGRTARVGRSMPGEEHPMAKLTAREVAQIRGLAASGMSYGRIARVIGSITRSTARAVTLRRSWQHVT
jgi:hypothetical protein